MIPFEKLSLARKQEYEQLLFASSARGCEYSFANLYLWGRQQAAFLHGCAAFFSHFNGRSVYPYPIGPGDKRAVLEEILQDARQRGIPCRLTGLLEEDRQELEAWFPGQFHIRSDRDSFDYVYAIDDLADLRGRKFQKKRNHYNRFCGEHPDYLVQPLDCCNLSLSQHMVNDWYHNRIRQNPNGDYLLESIAMARAFRHLQQLDMESLVLTEGGQVLAVTMGSWLGPDTFDIHFEKAREDVDGAYAAINCEFARYLRQKYPQLRYLNREDDLGIEGLRKAKLSYNPHHMTQKYWAYYVGDEYEEE